MYQRSEPALSACAGYSRVVAVAAAFCYAFSRPLLTLSLYLFAFVCDELVRAAYRRPGRPPSLNTPPLPQDGRFARKFNQCSTFGAVLDMVTDRLSTAGLCCVLCVLSALALSPTASLFFLAALCLDIGAHWAQMYASLLVRADSHKDVAECGSILLRVYYTRRIFMGALCVGAEVFYLALYLHMYPPSEAGRIGQAGPELCGRLPGGCAAGALFQSLGLGNGFGGVQLLVLLAFPFWAAKQATNVLQGRFAAQRLVRYEQGRL